MGSSSRLRSPHPPFGQGGGVLAQFPRVVVVVVAAAAAAAVVVVVVVVAVAVAVVAVAVADIVL